jgi:hypothetical protein
MGKYFEKLPIIHYGGRYARNIMAQVKFSDATAKDLSLYYPYSVKDHEYRTDIVAAKYYDDPDMVWLVNMCNGVVDSHYALGLSFDDLTRFITVKYGSVEIAQETVLYYKNDYESDDSVLDIATFEAMTPDFKKYYKATLGNGGNVSGYERKQEDWIVSTNRLVRIPLLARDATVGEWFTEGDARGYVYAIDDSYIYLKHMVDEFNDEEVLSTSVADDEAVFWTTVNAYDYEVEKNTNKRNIRLIDNRFASEVEEEVERLLK